MIEDQCKKCRKNSSCLENRVFDSNTCPNYLSPIDFDKHKIDLEKHTSQDVPSATPDSVISSDSDLQTENVCSQTNTVTREYLKQNTSIHGWLSFFLFSIVVSGLVSVIYSLMDYNPAAYNGSVIFASTDIVLGVLLCGLAFFTLYSFVQRRPDAVFLGKTYVILVFVSNILSFMGGDFEPTGIGSLSQVIRSIVWGMIWFLYLCFSKQVQEIIPNNYRKLTRIDYYLVIAIVIAPLLCISIGLNTIRSSQEENTSTFLREAVLSQGEYTDGRVIFSIPDGFSCQKQELDGIIVYTIEDDDIGSITLCSDYDSDQSKGNIHSYWKNWEDADAKKYASEIIINEQRTINGYTCYYKVKRYNIEGNFVFWRFALLFDDSTSKVCVLSCYDNGIDYYVDEIVKSIRFH